MVASIHKTKPAEKKPGQPARGNAMRKSRGIRGGVMLEPKPPFGRQKQQPPPGIEARMDPKPNFYGAAARSCAFSAG